MKILFLLRHAKAVPGTSSLQDPDRPLNDQGRAQARRIGNYFKEQKFELDLVLSSTALRARETTELFVKASERVTKVYYDQRIYEASRHQLFKVLAEIDQDKSNVVLVGHNPGLEELLQHLTGRFESMGASTLAKIDLEGAGWTGQGEMKGRLDWLIKPAELP
jgi:phosphohistidine phosphatase